MNKVTKWDRTGEVLVQSIQVMQDMGSLMCHKSIHLMADGRMI